MLSCEPTLKYPSGSAAPRLGAWRLWGIEYDEIIPIDAPEEPDWAIMAADIEAVEQEKRELTAVVERIPALLTYFTHLVDADITPIVCGRDRQKLRRRKWHAVA